MLDERPQRPGCLPSLRVVQVVTGKRSAEFLEDGDELPPRDRVADVALEGEQ